MKKMLFLLIFILLAGCTPQPQNQNFADLQITGSMELHYAEEFEVDYLSDGCSLVSIQEVGRYLVVPEGQDPPENIDGDITVLRQPVENIYLAATSAMCLFDGLDALGNISMSGTKAEGWYIENARAAMESGEIVYAGKYGAPDYELILSRDCGLAIESTMIDHAPEVKEKLKIWAYQF
jgi:iron complex transport system substrate-binding protein